MITKEFAIHDLETFIDYYKQMHIKNNIDINIVKRNISIILDFLDSYRNYEENTYEEVIK
jgi:hypothetical protein